MKYKGINFESEICARWAVFFDLLNWQWLYQPRIFDGWLPDFILLGKRVKVFTSIVSRDLFLSESTKIIDKVTFPENKLHIEFLLLGSQPVQSKEGIYLGLLKDGCDNTCCSWAPTFFGKWSGSESGGKNEKNLYGFCHSENQFFDRITDCYDGGNDRGDLWYFPDEEYHLNNLMTLWSKTEMVIHRNRS